MKFTLHIFKLRKVITKKLSSTTYDEKLVNKTGKQEKKTRKNLKTDSNISARGLKS